MYLSRKLKDICFELRMILQKIFRKDHYSDNEVWDLFSHNTRWLLPRIYQLKKHHMGYPAFSMGEDGWNYILGEIIFACVFTIYNDWDEKTTLEKKLVEELILEPFGDVREYLSGDFKWIKCDNPEYVQLDSCGIKVDKEKERINKVLEERAVKGFELLGKYYLNLWD